MHDVLEGHGGHGGREEGPFAMPVAVTLSILAVIMALLTLLGHRASKEELLLQTQEADQWALFQAKNSGLRSMQAGADMLGALMPVDKEAAATLREKYLKEAERYAEEKAEAQKEAEGLKHERQLVTQRGNRYESGEVVLQIALIICSLTLLTKKKLFWYGGMLLGVAGIVTAFSGFLLH